MAKSKIYTKTGDLGETGLVSGTRTKKSDSRISLYGELDELNSRIGYSVSLMATDLQYQLTNNFLHLIQSAIFDLGSNLACEAENRAKFKLPQISDEFISDLELEIDRMDGELPALKNFILPGGSIISASLHLCRTEARQVERKLITYYEQTKEELPINSIIFLNRLSDYFFILARYANKLNQVDEINWKSRK